MHTKMKQINENRLYVLISNELEPIYGAVQGGHAIAQWMIEHIDNLYWKNETVVYLSCDIEKVLYKLRDEDITIFREPDLNNKITSAAIVGNERTKSVFKNLKLLK